MAYTTYSGHRIYYEVHGEGQALVILNGIMMSTVSWKPFLPALKGYKVILLDFFDQGKSDSMTEPYDHSIQLKCVKAVLDDLSLEQVYMTGISYGAQIGLQFAVRYGRYVSKLAVFNGAAYTTPWLEDIGIAWKLAARTYDPELFFHVAIPYVYSPSFYSENVEWMHNRKKQLLSVFDRTFLDRMYRLIESSEGYDIRQALPELMVPVLAVGADYDYITPMSEAKEISQMVANGSYVVIESCGHASMYEKPDEFLTLIKGYLCEGPSVTIL